MKLSKNEAIQLRNIVNTAVMGGIETLVFQAKSIGVASGMRQGSCAIIARKDVPQLEQKMCITRLSTFRRRLDLLADSDSFEINTKESERGEITQVDISAGKAKTNYRCTSSALVKVPANVDDGGTIGLVTMTKEELALVINGIKTMSAPRVMLILKSDGQVAFESSDENDRFTVELEASIVTADEEATKQSSVFYYDSKVFESLLKASIGSASTLAFTVGIGGTIQFELNNCEMSIFAQIDGE
jgi:hypothetical protein